MGRVLCILRRHRRGPAQFDERGRFRICDRCGKFEGSNRMGPDGYDEMPPPVIGGTA